MKTKENLLFLAMIFMTILCFVAAVRYSVKNQDLELKVSDLSVQLAHSKVPMQRDTIRDSVPVVKQRVVEIDKTDYKQLEEDKKLLNDLNLRVDQLVSEAWPDVRIKSRHRGDRIIRCVVHVDTTERSVLDGGRFFHEHEYLGSEEAAVRWMNQTLRHVLDDVAEMVSIEDLISVNAALAEQYDSPENTEAYASIEDITEAVIVKCSEAFCEHHWSHEALKDVADELGIDLYEI